jgi:hypothetical protein
MNVFIPARYDCCLCDLMGFNSNAHAFDIETASKHPLIFATLPSHVNSSSPPFLLKAQSASLSAAPPPFPQCPSPESQLSRRRIHIPMASRQSATHFLEDLKFFAIIRISVSAPPTFPIPAIPTFLHVSKHIPPINSNIPK